LLSFIIVVIFGAVYVSGCRGRIFYPLSKKTFAFPSRFVNAALFIGHSDPLIPEQKVVGVLAINGSCFFDFEIISLGMSGSRKA